MKQSATSAVAFSIIAILIVVFAIVGIMLVSENAPTPEFPDFGNTNFPPAASGDDDTTRAYRAACDAGKYATVAINGRINRVVDINVYFSGFLVTSSGYIMTDLTRATRGDVLLAPKYDDYEVTVNTPEGKVKYIAYRTSYEDKVHDLVLLQISSQQSDKFTTEYALDIDSTDSIEFGTPVIIMGNDINDSILAHGGLIGNPSVKLTDSLNYYAHPVVLISGEVNKGKIGGPVIDERGMVVGMIASKYKISSTNSDQIVMEMGIAIKSSALSKLLAQIK